jgi:hypothetical protein
MKTNKTPNQAITLAGKKSDAKLGAPASKMRVTTTELLVPWKSFGKPPLMPGEKADDFYRLLVEAIREYDPGSMRERTYAWDIVALTTEIGRLRYINAALFSLADQPEEVTGTRYPPDFIALMRGESPSQPEPPAVKPKPAPTGFLVASKSMASTLRQNFDLVERNQKQITLHGCRRDWLYRELERLEAGSGVRKAEPVTVDVIYQEVDDD